MRILFFENKIFNIIFPAQKVVPQLEPESMCVCNNRAYVITD